MPWIRLYTEILHDPKLRRCSDSEFKLWITLLCLAGESTERGKIFLTPQKGLDIADLKDAGHFGEDGCIASALEYFKAVGMITIDKNGVIDICHFAERQYDSPSDHPAEIAKRVKKHRQSVKRECNGRDTDTDTDTDTESDTDREASCAFCKPLKANPSEIQSLVKFCHDAYIAARGKHPTFRVGTWIGVLDPLMKQHNKPDSKKEEERERVQRVYEHYLKSQDSWIQGKSFNITLFTSNFDSVSDALDRKEIHGASSNRKAGQPIRRHNAAPEEAFGASGKVNL